MINQLISMPCLCLQQDLHKVLQTGVLCLRMQLQDSWQPMLWGSIYHVLVLNKSLQLECQSRMPAGVHTILMKTHLLWTETPKRPCKHQKVLLWYPKPCFTTYFCE